MHAGGAAQGMVTNLVRGCGVGELHFVHDVLVAVKGHCVLARGRVPQLDDLLVGARGVHVAARTDLDVAHPLRVARNGLDAEAAGHFPDFDVCVAGARQQVVTRRRERDAGYVVVVASQCLFFVREKNDRKRETKQKTTRSNSDG